MKKAIDQTLRDVKRGVNKTVLKVPSIEQKVLDATCNEPWGPHGSLLADIAQATRNYHEYQIIMAVLWKRINDIGKNWRHVYKALSVLEYMVAHGSERVIDDIKEHAYQISTLSDFQYIDSSGRDQGNNVRRKSQTLVALVNDKERIQEVREKAAINRDKFRSTSAMGGMYRPGSGGYGDDHYEGRYGGRDYDRNGYGRERDDERYGRFSDSYSRDGDNYRDYEYGGRSRSEDGYQYGSNRSSERVGARAYDEDDRHSSRGSSVKPDDQHIEGRRLEHKFSEQNLGGPPSYEDAVNVSKSPVRSERDGEIPTATAAPPLSPPVGAKDAQSSPIDDATPQPSPAPNNVSPSQAAAEDGVESHSHVQTDSFDEFDPRGSISAAPSTSHKAEVDLFGSLSDAFAPGPLAIVPASFGISDSTSSATTSENIVLNQSFEDPFGDSPFKAFPSAEPAQPNNLASTTSFQPSVTTLERTKSSSSNQQFPDSFPGTYNPANASNLQRPPNQQFFLGEQSMQHNDVLSGVLPPSAPVAPSASQSDFPAPTGQQAFATSKPFPVTPPQQLTVQPGRLTRHSSLPYFDTSVDSSTNVGFQPPSRMSSLPSDDLLGGLVGQSGSEGSLALVPHQPSEKKFETKSTVWADTLNRGLVNLDISGSKTNPLSNIGVDFESLNRKEKRMEKPSTTPANSAIPMGKAMGSGSGIGRAGAGVLRPAQNPMEPGMGMGMGGMNMSMSGMGMARPGVGVGMGNYGTMSVNQQPMGMGGRGMGMNIGGIGMNMGMGQGGVPMQPSMGQGVPMQPPHGLAPGSNMTNYPMAGRGGYPPQQTYQYGGGYR